ncbi:MAG: type II toxin-antitoxin system VapC family toxin [Blastocatellia bacterium]
MAKRYVHEIGTPLVNHLFNQAQAASMVCLLESIGEVISVFVRGRNAKLISATMFRQVSLRFDREITYRNDVEKIRPKKLQVIDSWKLIEKHSINSSDAIILRCALYRAALLRAGGDDLILVSSDLRLIRAAKAEGLITFNPETDDQQTLDSLIN